MHSLQYGRGQWFLATLFAIVIGAISFNTPLVSAAITQDDVTACADKHGIGQFDVQGNYIGCLIGPDLPNGPNGEGPSEDPAPSPPPAFVDLMAQIDIKGGPHGQPAAVRSGENIGPRMHLAVQNTGEKSISDVFQIAVGLYGPGDLLHYTRLKTITSSKSKLLPGQSRSYPVDEAVLPRTAVSGIYQLCAEVDSAHQVREVDENNNLACTPISIMQSGGVKGETAKFKAE